MVLITHGRLAEELRSAMEHVVGKQRQVATVCIGPEDDMAGQREQIRASIAAVDQGDGVVLLTDIMGGTPCNLAVSLADGKHIDVIAGVNLPLLVKLAKVRGSERLAEAVNHAAAAGRKYIATAGHFPNGNGHGHGHGHGHHNGHHAEPAALAEPAHPNADPTTADPAATPAPGAAAAPPGRKPGDPA